MPLPIVGAMALAAAGITLAELRTMSAATAGDRLLTGQAHGPIVAKREVVTGMIAVPGRVEMELDEKALPRSRGCAFRRWKVSLSPDPSTSGSTVTVDGRPYAIWQVALATASGCGGQSYAYVNPRIDPDRALRSLAAVADLAKRRPASVSVSCRTEIKSGLCDDRKTLLRRIVGKGAWLVTDDGATILYGVRGQVPTRVALTGDPVTSVAVSETIPAPF